MRQIMVISGKDRVGKTTTARQIVKSFPGWKRFAFADKLREEMMEIYGIPKEDLMDKSKIVKLCEVRDNKVALRLFLKHNIVESAYYFHMFECDMRTLYNIHGTRIRRAEDPDYWLRQCVQEIIRYGGNVVMDDMRFPNEFDIVDRLGNVNKFFLYNDNTMGLENAKSIAEEALLNHVSSHKDEFEFLKVAIPVEESTNDLISVIMKEYK